MIANSVAKQALTLSFLDNFLMLAVIFAALIPVVFLMRAGRGDAETSAES